MAAVKDRIYVFGGEIEKQGICQPVDCALECYTMQCDQWHTIAEKFNFPVSFTFSSGKWLKIGQG